MVKYSLKLNNFVVLRGFWAESEDAPVILEIFLRLFGFILENTHRVVQKVFHIDVLMLLLVDLDRILLPRCPVSNRNLIYRLSLLWHSLGVFRG